MEDALVASKLDALAAEYSHLLASQLESQRAFYEGRAAKAAAEAEARSASALQCVLSLVEKPLTLPCCTQCSVIIEQAPVLCAEQADVPECLL